MKQSLQLKNKTFIIFFKHCYKSVLLLISSVKMFNICNENLALDLCVFFCYLHLFFHFIVFCPFLFSWLFTLWLLIFSLLADSYGPYHSGLLAPQSYQNQTLSLASPRAIARSKATVPLGPRGRSTSAPNVSFVNTGTTEEVCGLWHRALYVCLAKRVFRFSSATLFET